jgi:hypothetical protein
VGNSLKDFLIQYKDYTLFLDSFTDPCLTTLLAAKKRKIENHSNAGVYRRIMSISIMIQTLQILVIDKDIH